MRVSSPSFGCYKCGGGRFWFEWHPPVCPESSKKNQNSTSMTLCTAVLFKAESISSATLLLFLRYCWMLVSRENVVLTWEARLAKKQTNPGLRPNSIMCHGKAEAAARHYFACMRTCVTMCGARTNPLQIKMKTVVVFVSFTFYMFFRSVWVLLQKFPQKICKYNVAKKVERRHRCLEWKACLCVRHRGIKGGRKRMANLRTGIEAVFCWFHSGVETMTHNILTQTIISGGWSGVNFHNAH